jgi:Arm DNA-binding domain
MSKAIHKRVLSPLFLRKLKPTATGFMIWDAKQGHLALSVRPSGHMAWKAIYNHHGRTRWYTIGTFKLPDGTETIGLAEARKVASHIMARAALGEDPQGEKAARWKPMTFEILAARYVEYAKKKNRSWNQADYLVRTHLLPRWKGKGITAISRADVKELMREIKAPVVANQALAAASAIFSWAVKEEIGGAKENPCYKIDRNETRSRDRILADSELPRFWSAFDDIGLISGTALKVILLTGQRPGEIAHMRYEHVKELVGDAGQSRPCFEVAGHQKWREPSRLVVGPRSRTNRFARR